MGKPHFMFSKMLTFTLVSFFLVCTTIFNLPVVSGTGDGWLQVYPSSGPPRTEVQLTVDVKAYVEQELLQEYIGLKYKIVWDVAGWPEPFEYMANIKSPTTWKIVGEAEVQGDGTLRGQAIIPDIWEYEFGEHYIFAIYENMRTENRAWWWTGFSVTEPRWTLTVIVVGEGRVDLVCGDTSDTAKKGSQFFTYPYHSRGTWVYLTAVPESGWRFSGWSSDLSGMINPEGIKMDYDKTVTATFTKEGGDDDDNGPVCLAMATYGSPAGEVVYMRHVRDDLIGATVVGKSLVEGWNTFYYLWSPFVARPVAKSNLLQSAFKVLLAPLLGVINIAEQEYHCLAWLNPELASITAFMTAAILAITIYIVLPTSILGIMIKHEHSLFRILRRKHKIQWMKFGY